MRAEDCVTVALTERVQCCSCFVGVRGGDGALGRVRGVRRAVPEAVRIRVRETRGTVVLRAGLLFMLFMQ